MNDSQSMAAVMVALSPGPNTLWASTEKLYLSPSAAGIVREGVSVKMLVMAGESSSW